MPEVRYEIARHNTLPTGRSCSITETDGLAVVQIRPGDATQALCDELNEYHRIIFSEHRWFQTPITDPQRLEQAPQGLAIAEAEWVIDHEGRLPAEIVVVPIENCARFTWLIRPNEASDQLAREMNRYLKRIVGDGLWRQNWTTAS
ncbi:hypothetical protein [Streptomyces sp. NPDC059071]|uniref:hypothetical protein n=1 Tax=unclassified Streptomyces TaxID=2593676 RepID=UPI00364F33D8